MFNNFVLWSWTICDILTSADVSFSKAEAFRYVLLLLILSLVETMPGICACLSAWFLSSIFTRYGNYDLAQRNTNNIFSKVEQSSVRSF